MKMKLLRNYTGERIEIAPPIFYPIRVVREACFLGRIYGKVQNSCSRWIYGRRFVAGKVCR